MEGDVGVSLDSFVFEKKTKGVNVSVDSLPSLVPRDLVFPSTLLGSRSGPPGSRVTTEEVGPRLLEVGINSRFPSVRLEGVEGTGEWR